ncbi:MAG: hypothetical protein LBS43_03040 [Prevotellaceae bacterium]|jgi:hypothetical protein|nr:hypothetical protein [Prevotellaceae bacterium]
MKYIYLISFSLLFLQVNAQPNPAGWKKENLTREVLINDFSAPPPGYGNVAFYWWLGDPLTKERLSWQLERLAQMGHGMTGLQINYAHSDKGGLTYGYSMSSEPPLFSDEWWKLVQWFMQEAKKRDISISLSDYQTIPTRSPGKTESGLTGPVKVILTGK